MQLAVAKHVRHIPIGVLLGATDFHEQVLQIAFGVVTPSVFFECAQGNKTMPAINGFTAVCGVQFDSTITAI